MCRTDQIKVRLRRLRQRAEKLGAPFEWVKAGDWKKKVEQYENTCIYCGRKPKAGERISIDHFVPLSRGGSHSLDNLVPACTRCNNSKNDCMPWEWPKLQRMNAIKAGKQS